MQWARRSLCNYSTGQATAPAAMFASCHLKLGISSPGAIACKVLQCWWCQGPAVLMLQLHLRHFQAVIGGHEILAKHPGLASSCNNNAAIKEHPCFL